MGEEEGREEVAFLERSCAKWSRAECCRAAGHRELQGGLGRGRRGGHWHRLRQGHLDLTSTSLPWSVQPVSPSHCWPGLSSSRKPSRWPPLASLGL